MIFYILDGAIKKGPFTVEELQQVKVAPTTLVSNPNGDGWIEACKVEELKDAIDLNPIIQQPVVQRPIIINTGNGQIFDVNAPIPPNTWLVQSILLTILCCLPFGIVSIVYAAKVDGLYAMKQYAEAQEASNMAKKWFYIGLFTGLGLYIAYFIFVIFFAVSGAAFGTLGY